MLEDPLSAATQTGKSLNKGPNVRVHMCVWGGGAGSSRLKTIARFVNTGRNRSD